MAYHLFRFSCAGVGRALSLVDFYLFLLTYGLLLLTDDGVDVTYVQVSMGMVTAATIAGPPDDLGLDIAGCLLYYVLALVCLVGWSKLFDFYTTEWATWKEIERGNIAAAISQFSQMVSAAMLMASAISKTFELATFFAWCVCVRARECVRVCARVSTMCFFEQVICILSLCVCVLVEVP